MEYHRAWFISCMLIFFLRVGTNRLVGFDDYIVAVLSCVNSCILDHIIGNSSFSGSFDMDAFMGWCFDRFYFDFPQIRSILTPVYKQWKCIFLWFWITMFTAVCLSSCHRYQHYKTRRCKWLSIWAHGMWILKKHLGHGAYNFGLTINRKLNFDTSTTILHPFLTRQKLW